MSRSSMEKTLGLVTVLVFVAAVLSIWALIRSYNKPALVTPVTALGPLNSTTNVLYNPNITLSNNGTYFISAYANVNFSTGPAATDDLQFQFGSNNGSAFTGTPLISTYNVANGITYGGITNGVFQMTISGYFVTGAQNSKLMLQVAGNYLTTGVATVNFSNIYYKQVA